MSVLAVLALAACAGETIQTLQFTSPQSQDVTDAAIQGLGQILGDYDFDHFRDRLRRGLEVVEVDLDEDGMPEIIVSLSVGEHCGSAGCAAYVMKRHGDRLLPIGEMVTQGEVEVLPERDKGYHRLRSPYVTLFWAGREYFEEDWYREAKAKCRLRSHFGYPQDPCGP
ncbi:hypothetical protein WV31_03210 [Magnetospirillum sp. ME-1]|uniref:hypothetical protein n=1 Tax=Magnetospirillum sp. ME-1 TaxID=1639348 RepID=UPI000A17CE33|nr:hypothetical protein [Magnetospirillum sp. ME-1]ARJ64751.1 hypothetical protein WV31_03210 [Magnetospirillum sp. ME-1]